MTLDFAPIAVDRVDDYNRAIYRGFHNAVTDERDIEMRRERWVEGRWWAATDHDEIVATVRTLSLITTMPGGAPLTSCGLTAVGTLASHRRRGLMAGMLRASLAQGREMGEPLATLIAAEWPIYGRFGFGVAAEHASYELDARATWTTLGAGTVGFVTPAAFRAAAPAIYERHCARSASEINRDEWVWDRIVDGFPSDTMKDFHLICRDDAGTAVGYARYTIEDKWTDGRRPEGVVTIGELIADTPAYEAALWRFACELDWVVSVKAADRSISERLPWWLADGRYLCQTMRADFVWARPLDVPACLTARTYVAPLDVVIDVVDPLGLAGGRFRLVTDGFPGGPDGASTGVDSATCTPTTASADITVPVATLGATLFGGGQLATLAAAGLADEHRAGALGRLAAATTSPTPPWSATWF